MVPGSLTVARWAGVCSLTLGFVWACGSSDTNPFEDVSRGGQSASGGTGNGGASGGSSGSSSGGDATGGASGNATGGASTGGNATGGDAAGGATTGGTTGDGGESGTDATGGTATGGSATGGNATGGVSGGGSGGAAGGGKGGASGAGMGGGAGTPAIGGAGMGGAGASGAGSGGSAGAPSKGCKANGDCAGTEYCKKATCNATEGRCTAHGPDCAGDKAAFDPVCGCDGITYWNSCVIEHEGFSVAMTGECTGNDRPTCTRDQGGDSCPTRLHARCYRPVDRCGDPSPMMGVCWVLPAVCPPNEEQTQRYCGGTAGAARCIGLCEVIGAENSFQRDAGTCN